jgi:cation diffusion facilitator family transporter
MLSLSEALRHDHDHGVGAPQHESKTRWVVALTFGMMVGELVFGYLTGSLALTADGWHMATHVGALGLGSIAYWFARTRSREAVFTFGTGKVHALAGYTSAILLALIALWMFYESAVRLLHPVAIDFRDAIGVAALGLAVNLVSVRLLHVDHGHGHGHGHVHGHGHEHGHGHGHAHGLEKGRGHEHAHAQGHEHGHEAEAELGNGHGHGHPAEVEHEKGHVHGGAHGHGHDDGHERVHAEEHPHADQNLRASYTHVLADTITSLFTICALLGGRYLGWTRLDPIVGIFGGVVILRWSLTLCHDAARQLLDMVPSAELAERVRERLETIPGTEVVDLHLWQIGPAARACLASVISERDRSPLEYAAELRREGRFEHVTVEVHRGTRGGS